MSMPTLIKRGNARTVITQKRRCALSRSATKRRDRRSRNLVPTSRSAGREYAKGWFSMSPVSMVESPDRRSMITHLVRGLIAVGIAPWSCFHFSIALMRALCSSASGEPGIATSSLMMRFLASSNSSTVSIALTFFGVSASSPINDDCQFPFRSANCRPGWYPCDNESCRFVRSSPTRNNWQS
jgi:hypothetical protein